MILHTTYLEEFELGDFSLQDSDSESSIPSPQYVPISGGIGLVVGSRGMGSGGNSGSDDGDSQASRGARSRLSVGSGGSRSGGWSEDVGNVELEEDDGTRGRGGGRVGERGRGRGGRGARQIMLEGRTNGDIQIGGTRGRRGGTRSRRGVVRGVGEARGRNGGTSRSSENENEGGPVSGIRLRFGGGRQVSRGQDGGQNSGRIGIGNLRTATPGGLNAALAQVCFTISRSSFIMHLNRILSCLWEIHLTRLKGKTVMTLESLLPKRRMKKRL